MGKKVLTYGSTFSSLEVIELLLKMLNYKKNL
jgi:hypothetical protein